MYVIVRLFGCTLPHSRVLMKDLQRCMYRSDRCPSRQQAVEGLDFDENAAASDCTGTIRCRCRLSQRCRPHMFVPCKISRVLCSLILFSRPFLSQCSFPFLLFYVFLARAISCPSLLFLLEECFCIFLTGINRFGSGQVCKTDGT